MKKNYILVSVDLPAGDSHAEEQARLAFASAIFQIKDQALKGQKLSENVWLLDRDGDTSSLAHIVYSCTKQNLKYSVRYLSSE
ncbi:MAG: hypothetical protein H2172_11795 [Opitutus sp.]|nr:hypothetical protein [Opitutus sp.]MCS6275463.1 hypothetical protein [Opitutus sp.]MCS6277031.1 hypothetical protein [Opitutus sp.]MCS6299922.1 hypothetical protein [Opitutus sp.]